MKFLLQILVGLWLLLSGATYGEPLVPFEVSGVVRAAGYTLVEKTSAIVRMPDESYLLRVYDDSSYNRESIVTVRNDELIVIEASRYSGEQMTIEPRDVNSDGIMDIVISEMFEVGGGQSKWSVRIYVDSQGYKQAFEGMSATKPDLRDLTGDNRLELLVTSDPYGYDYRPSFCGMLYELSNGKYILHKKTR